VNWVLTGIPLELLATLGASLSAVVTLLYALRVRRRRVAVPFSPVWQAALRAERPNQLWDRLKWLLSLLVHLLVLALVMLALGDPRSDRAKREGRSIVVLLDTSASMAARDEVGHRTRFERAKELARETLRGVGPRDELLLVAMDGQLRPLTTFARDTALAEEALAGLEPSATSADLGAAFRFASQALAGRSEPVIVVISDGAAPQTVDGAAAVSGADGATVVYRGVGRSDGNVGITAFNVRRYPSNRTNHEVYARVQNHADAVATVELTIRGGGALVHSEQITLAPGAGATRVFADLPAAGRELEARVEVVAGDVVDVFPVDDTAYTLLPDRRPLRVLMVTDGNLYLEAPFLLNESLEVERVAPAAYDAASAEQRDPPFDLTVFDGVAPPTPSTGNFLYFAPRGPSSPWADDGDRVVDAPIIHASERGHPMMRWITGLRDVNVAQAVRLRTTPRDQVVASAIGGAPMIVARETAQQRLMAVAFDVSASDFPLRVAFPVLLLNAIDWFSRDADSLVEPYRTGETWFVPLGDREIDTVTVTTPSGRQFSSRAQQGRAVLYGAEAGFYTIEAGERSVQIAGNIASSDESRIAPATRLVVDGADAAAAFEDASVDMAFDPWWVLVLLAWVVVLAEWVSWHRRVTV